MPQIKSSILRALDGRGERIRTSDPLVPNQVLYQAEPLPELAVGKDVYELKGPWLSPSKTPANYNRVYQKVPARDPDSL
jgi:hypothetical protein